MKQGLSLLAILLLAAAAIWYSLAPQYPIKRGLDLQGGMRVTLEPDPTKEGGTNVSPDLMEAVRRVIETRVNSFGLSGSEVRQKGEQQILVLLPGAKNPEEALGLLTNLAQLEFRHFSNVQGGRNMNARYKMDHTPGDPEKGIPDRYSFTDTTTNKTVPQSEVIQSAPLILRGDALKPNSKPDINPGNGEPLVTFELEPEGAKVFGDFTRANVNEILAVILNDEVISAPSINEPITDRGQISGGFKTIAEARVLAHLLNSGALPVPLRSAETQTVGATLGAEAVQRSIAAGLAGLGLVLLFMVAYYWLPGILACLSLVIYAAVTFSIFKLTGIVLDLPGITGFILSIGMAVDGNILIFERLKEELKAGKSFNAAIDAGFNRAFTAILDSNITIWIIAGILLWLGAPVIKGFAITLAIGNAVAMFTAITVTRVLLRAVTQMPGAHNPKLYALNNSWLALVFPQWRDGAVLRIFDKRRIYLGLSAAAAIISIALIALTPFGKGLQPGIDFTGGSVLEAAFRQPNVTRDQVMEVLRANGAGEATVRMGHSEQPFTRVTVEATDVDAVNATRMQDVLSRSPGLEAFDVGAFQAGTPGKSFKTTALYTDVVTQGEVESAVRPLNLKGLKVATVVEPHNGDNRLAVAEISTAQLSPDELNQKVRPALDKIGGGVIAPMSRSTSIGPTIAREVTTSGLFSVVVGTLAMILFLAFRFAIGSFANGLKFGAGAGIALFHDILITVGFFALMGVLAGWPVDSLFLTACLGLLGLSVNDTIVVFDRVRENLYHRRKGETFAEVADRSMTQSFDRSFNTNFFVILALLAMAIFGGDTLRLFNIALLFGMVIGSYSSVFVATPLVVMLERASQGAAPTSGGGGRPARRDEPVRSRRETAGAAARASRPESVPGPAAEPGADGDARPSGQPVRPSTVRPRGKKRRM